jgi:hypothetical protein
MLKRTLVIFFAVATLGGMATPALASPASPAKIGSVQVCAHLNTEYCLSSQGLGALVVLTKDRRTTYNVVSVAVGLYEIQVSNEPTHCVQQAPDGGTEVITNTDCISPLAKWMIPSAGHYENWSTHLYLGTSGVFENSAVVCGTPATGFDWTWDLEYR